MYAFDDDNANSDDDSVYADDGDCGNGDKNDGTMTTMMIRCFDGERMMQIMVMIVRAKLDTITVTMMLTILMMCHIKNDMSYGPCQWELQV